MPFTYALEQLAMRWHVAPWVLDEAPVEWIIRGLEFADLENVKVNRD